jgi:hypothetical protein
MNYVPPSFTTDQPWVERTAEVAQRHGPEFGLASDIRYTVRYYHKGGSTDYGPIVPSQRRPSLDTEIAAARPGDPCIIIFSNGKGPRFLIFEGLVSEACT